MKYKGEVRLNGRSYSRSDIKWIGGYVMQDDVLNPNLTVYETLMYTAKLRLAPDLSVTVCFFGL
jgi:ABC-type multidrug transport system ATPase subunit